MKKDLDETKKIMGSLVRMPPKPHEEMKLGKRPRPKLKDQEKSNRGDAKKR